MALLFALGSACFVLGSVPLYFDHVDAAVVGATFFVGSLLFTSAASLQFHGAATTGPLFRKQPARLDWWSAGVQWVGTLCFNVSTLAALFTGLSAAQAQKLVWSPDFYGSAAFLISSAIAIVSLRVAHAGRHDRRIGRLNMAGSIAFGVAAVAAFVLPHTGEPISIEWVNLGTALGGVCFFVASVLMMRPAPPATEAMQLEGAVAR